MPTTEDTGNRKQIGQRGRWHSFWVRIAVPVVRTLLLAGAATGFWRIVPNGKPPKQNESTAIGEIPALSQMRIEYPFSLIPGGVRSDDDLEAARAADPLLAAHYADVGFLRPAFLAEDRLFYASYRGESSIVWTRSMIRVRAGEAVLADRSGNLIRGRCGNRLSETPRLPVGSIEPPQSTFETPVVSFPGDIGLQESFAGDLAVDSVPLFPSIEGPAGGSKTPDIPVTLPPTPEPPPEAPFDNSFILDPVILPPVARPLPPYKIPPSEPKTPSPEPPSAGILTAGILLAVYIFRGVRPRTKRGL